MDGVLALLLIPLLLAGLILVILNMLDVDISLSRSTVEDELTDLEKHKGSTAHTDMLNVSHNSSTGAHTNFDDKYMSSSSVQALIDENNSSSSHRDLIGTIISSSLDASLNTAIATHNTSSSAHELNQLRRDLSVKLSDFEDHLNDHTHTTPQIMPADVTIEEEDDGTYTMTDNRDATTRRTTTGGGGDPVLAPFPVDEFDSTTFINWTPV